LAKSATLASSMILIFSAVLLKTKKSNE